MGPQATPTRQGIHPAAPQNPNEALGLSPSASFHANTKLLTKEHSQELPELGCGHAGLLDYPLLETLLQRSGVFWNRYGPGQTCFVHDDMAAGLADNKKASLL